MEENKLKKVEMFFEADVKIKSLMNSVLDNYKYVQNKSMEMEVETKIFQVLKDIKLYMNEIINNFMPYERERFNEFYEGIIEKFINMTGRSEKLRELFNTYVIDMREDFVKSVNLISGYNIFSGSGVIPPVTINEYLHFLHATIVNNENLYKDMDNILSVKEDNKEIFLHGKDSDLARGVFNSLVSSDTISSRIDILNTQDKILLMLRDLGHALMIEVHLEGDKAYVNYHIPKICNYIMVNELPGVQKVTKEDRATVGKFAVDKSELPRALAEFVMRVPNDADVYKPGGLFEDFGLENYEDTEVVRKQ